MVLVQNADAQRLAATAPTHAVNVFSGRCSANTGHENAGTAMIPRLGNGMTETSARLALVTRDTWAATVLQKSTKLTLRTIASGSTPKSETSRRDGRSWIVQQAYPAHQKAMPLSYFFRRFSWN